MPRSPGVCSISQLLIWESISRPSIYTSGLVRLLDLAPCISASRPSMRLHHFMETHLKIAAAFERACIQPLETSPRLWPSQRHLSFIRRWVQQLKKHGSSTSVLFGWIRRALCRISSSWAALTQRRLPASIRFVFEVRKQWPTPCRFKSDWKKNLAYLP